MTKYRGRDTNRADSAIFSFLTDWRHFAPVSWAFCEVRHCDLLWSESEFPPRERDSPKGAPREFAAGAKSAPRHTQRGINRLFILRRQFAKFTSDATGRRRAVRPAEAAPCPQRRLSECWATLACRGRQGEGGNNSRLAAAESTCEAAGQLAVGLCSPREAER